MSDRETLEAALQSMGRWELAPFDFDLLTVAGAVKERLAQLPEKCGTCGGRGFLVTSVLMGGQAGYAGPICPTCHGRGTVYPAELVEQIADALQEYDGCNYGKVSAAVLDAINGYGQTGRET